MAVASFWAWVNYVGGWRQGIGRRSPGPTTTSSRKFHRNHLVNRLPNFTGEVTAGRQHPLTSANLDRAAAMASSRPAAACDDSTIWGMPREFSFVVQAQQATLDVVAASISALNAWPSAARCGSRS